MKKITTYEEVMDLFDQQMNIVKIKLTVSFRRYADARDETIEFFSRKTGIPKSHFEQRVLQDQINWLTT